MALESLQLHRAPSGPLRLPGTHQNCSSAEHVLGPSSSQVSGEGMQALKQTRPPGKSKGCRE